jgi:hypothetical protein
MTTEWSAFAAALRAPGTPAPPGLKAWNGSDVQRRFDVHRNTVTVTLVQALGETLPVCRQAQGPECFDALARGFLLAQPPRGPVLAEWGDGFAPWLQTFEPAAAWPWLPPLAELERARVRAFHAPDARPLGVADIAPQLADAARLPTLRLQLHPSYQVLRACWGVVSLWAAHQGDRPAAELTVHEIDEAALVLRDDGAGGGDVVVLPLPMAAAAFCAALAAGQTLADAVSIAATEAAEAAEAATTPGAGSAGFDLATTLALLIRHGALVGWHSPGVH